MVVPDFIIPNISSQNAIYCQQLFTSIESVYFRNILLCVCGLIIFFRNILLCVCGLIIFYQLLHYLVEYMKKEYGLKFEFDGNANTLIYTFCMIAIIVNFDLKWYFIPFFGLGSYVIYYKTYDKLLEKIFIKLKIGKFRNWKEKS